MIRLYETRIALQVSGMELELFCLDFVSRRPACPWGIPHTLLPGNRTFIVSHIVGAWNKAKMSI